MKLSIAGALTGALLLLFACGGGGGDSPAASNEATRASLSQIIGSSDILLHAERNPNGNVWIERYPPAGNSSLEALEGSVEDDVPPHYRRQPSRHGVSRAQSQQTSRPFPNELLEYHRLAGWMSHSAYLVEKVEFSESGVPIAPEIFAYSIGKAATTNPVSGSATWRGVMAGFDTSGSVIRSATEGNPLEGDVVITIGDFSRPAADVQITNFRDVATGRQLRDWGWSNVPVDAGRFRSAGLSGQFYGPNHEEVGGIVSSEGRMLDLDTSAQTEFLGTFGAVRQ